MLDSPYNQLDVLVTYWVCRQRLQTEADRRCGSSSPLLAVSPHETSPADLKQEWKTERETMKSCTPKQMPDARVSGGKCKLVCYLHRHGAYIPGCINEFQLCLQISGGFLYKINERWSCCIWHSQNRMCRNHARNRANTKGTSIWLEGKLSLWQTECNERMREKFCIWGSTTSCRATFN